MRYAILLMKDGCPARDPRLLATYRETGDLDAVCRRARYLLTSERDVEQPDFVLVREITQGREVFRQTRAEAERADVFRRAQRPL